MIRFIAKTLITLVFVGSAAHAGSSITQKIEALQQLLPEAALKSKFVTEAEFAKLDGEVQSLVNAHNLSSTVIAKCGDREWVRFTSAEGQIQISTITSNDQQTQLLHILGKGQIPQSSLYSRIDGRILALTASPDEEDLRDLQVKMVLSQLGAADASAKCGDKSDPLDNLKQGTGLTKEIVLEREAQGFYDTDR